MLSRAKTAVRNGRPAYKLSLYVDNISSLLLSKSQTVGSFKTALKTYPHPVVAANCLEMTRPCNDFHVTARYKLSVLLLLLLLLSLVKSDALTMTPPSHVAWWRHGKGVGLAIKRRGFDYRSKYGKGLSDFDP